MCRKEENCQDDPLLGFWLILKEITKRGFQEEESS